MLPYHVSNCVYYAFIDPVWCHLGSMIAQTPCVVCATSAYADAKCLHWFGQFNAFLDVFNSNFCKSYAFWIFQWLKGMTNSLLGSASVWYGKFLCAKCHTGTQPAALPRYDTSRTRIYCIILTLSLITNNTEFGWDITLLDFFSSTRSKIKNCQHQNHRSRNKHGAQ